MQSTLIPPSSTHSTQCSMDTISHRRSVSFAPLPPTPRDVTRFEGSQSESDDTECGDIDLDSEPEMESGTSPGRAHSAKLLAAFKADSIHELLGGRKRRPSNASSVSSASPPKEGSAEAWNIPLKRMSSSERGRRSSVDWGSIFSTSPGKLRLSSSSSGASLAGSVPGSCASIEGGDRHRGRYMLNGRVYKPEPGSLPHTRAGKPRQLEPEFVEWGFSGLGSVGKSAPATSSLSERPTSIAETDSTIGDDDDDDGSGMEWVRKRRQQRALQAQAALVN